MSNENMLAADQKKAKVAAVIFVLGFLALHAAAYFLSATPHFGTVNYIATGVAVLALIILAGALWVNNDYVDETRWPHLVVIVLSFTSAVLIGYCSTC